MVTQVIHMPYVVLPSPPLHPMEIEWAQRRLLEEQRAENARETALRLFLGYLENLPRAESPEDVEATYGILAGLWNQLPQDFRQVLGPVYEGARAARQRILTRVREYSALREAQLRLERKRMERASQELDVVALKERLADDVLRGSPRVRFFQEAVQHVVNGDWGKAMGALRAFYGSAPEYASLGVVPLLDMAEEMALHQYNTLMRNLQLRLQSASLGEILSRAEARATEGVQKEAYTQIRQKFPPGKEGAVVSPEVLGVHDVAMGIASWLAALDKTQDVNVQREVWGAVRKQVEALYQGVAKLLGVQGVFPEEELLATSIAEALHVLRQGGSALQEALAARKVIHPNHVQVARWAQYYANPSAVMPIVESVVGSNPALSERAPYIAARVAELLSRTQAGGGVERPVGLGLDVGKQVWSALLSELASTSSQDVGEHVKRGFYAAVAGALRREVSRLGILGRVRSLYEQVAQREGPPADESSRRALMEPLLQLLTQWVPSYTQYAWEWDAHIWEDADELLRREQEMRAYFGQNVAAARAAAERARRGALGDIGLPGGVLPFEPRYGGP